MGKNSGGLFLLFNCRPHEDNVHITQAPLYHTAVNNWTTTSLQIGHTVVLMDRWTAEGALERYERYSVTQSHMVPTMFNRMLQLPDEVRLKYDVSSLRSMVHAAAPCPVETKKRMIEWWGDSLWEYYAATEGGGTWVSAKEWMEHPGTVGKPWPNSEVIVVDEEGEKLPPYESGTIYMRMGGNQFEYYKDADKTSKSRLKDSGSGPSAMSATSTPRVPVPQRPVNDMIIVGGVNVYPAEIEGALIQHPAVADVAVFGVPNEDTGEEIKAVVELRAGFEPNDATQVDHGLLPRQHRPAEASSFDRLHHRDAARSQRQALQAQAPRAVLGRSHPQHLNQRSCQNHVSRSAGHHNVVCARCEIAKVRGRALSGQSMSGLRGSLCASRSSYRACIWSMKLGLVGM